MMTAAEIGKHLTERQRRFVEALLVCGRTRDAAISAGYSEKNADSQASRMLKNDKVLAYRRAYAIQEYDKLGMSPQKVLLDLMELYKRCMSAEPVLEWQEVDKKMRLVPNGEWQFDTRGALKALELIGKQMGMFGAKVEVSGTAALQVQIADAMRELSI